jgi:hypothetical protein
MVAQIESSVLSLDWIALPSRHEAVANHAFYKWGFQVQRGTSTALDLRDTVIQQLNQRGVLAGSGFHGFGNRSSKRCRRAESIDYAEAAAQSTVLIHHTALNSTLADYLKELDRQLRDANLIDQ